MTSFSVVAFLRGGFAIAFDAPDFIPSLTFTWAWQGYHPLSGPTGEELTASVPAEWSRNQVFQYLRETTATNYSAVLVNNGGSPDIVKPADVIIYGF
jgi:hypothetical protein